jgi:DNA-binding XRE family transcriptional regulator
MLAVVKTPHIEIRGKRLSSEFIKTVRTFFGSEVEVIEEDDEVVDWFKTDLHRTIAAQREPGSAIRAFRKRDGMTQAALASKLGISAQAVSDLENGRRPIGARTAKRLAESFKRPLEDFIQ